MKREIEINHEAIAYSERANLQQPAIDLAEEAFKAGAQWADEHPHWISVEDELPKIEQDVLMWSGGANDILIGYRCSSKANGWYCYDDEEYWHNITHWMPLPAPPTLQKMQNASLAISKMETTTMKGEEQ